MPKHIGKVDKPLDNEVNVQLREMVSVLVLGTEVCLTEPRVSALNLPHAASVLHTAKSLCVLMKKLPSASLIPDPEASNERPTAAPDNVQALRQECKK
jgi:hypothetical protein